MLQYINKQNGERAEIAETAYAAVSETATTPDNFFWKKMYSPETAWQDYK